ncbi:hypothetical protein K4039_16825 [Lyngbya sp. CCAP 1446/10]|uniref:hypothetical protein n=1 Tax=Lyngbya sp. CCAP 1446/10 TaxID=439293 RepID=UPI00223894DA|nr:hypothetical protein [Lyngbya sp. CCAP 1446/10]MCW6051708.1 hypothetical protein [Lyngbya sp. CCAP 1446/10]
MKNNSQSNQDKFIRKAIASAFILQAVIIDVQGNLDVVSGKPALNVIQGMIVQGIELIVKANRSRKSVEEIDRPSQLRITPNPDN